MSPSSATFNPHDRRLGTALVVAATLALTGLAAHAQAPSSAPPQPAAGPPPAPAKEVRFPAFEVQTLANGLRVVVIPQHEQPLVSLRLLLPAGKTFEPAGKAGLAKATAALLTQGTTTRSAQQLAEAIDFVGGALTTGASVESGFASVQVTSDQLELGFTLLSDVILRPAFAADELERWRQQAVNGLRVQDKSAAYLASTAFARVLLGDHPYGRPANGTAESLGTLTRDDLVAFHRQRYVAGQALLAVVGDVEPTDAFARAGRAFGGWPAGQAAAVPEVPNVPRRGHRIVVIDKPDAVQTEIRIGQVAIAFRDPDLYASEVYDSVAGGHSSSRLSEEIRGKRGLTYGIASGFVAPTQPGWFSVATSTKTATTVETLTVTLDVLKGLGREIVPAPELAAATAYITGAFPLEIETASGTASKILEAMRYGYGREFLEHYNERIAGVTAADLQRFARERIHPDDMTIVLVGNAAAFTAELGQKLGAFETIPANDLDFLTPDLRKVKDAPPAVPTP